MGDITQRWPSTWRGRVPGLAQGDAQQWTIFMDRRGNEWREYAYDVELHGGATPVSDPDPAFNRQWARLISKRVDAIGFRASGATLFEVRDKAAWQSVGQLLGYRDLFPRDYPDVIVESAMLVTNFIDPQIRAFAERQGLIVWLTTTAN